MKKDSLISRLWSIFFPPKCLGCGEMLSEAGGILCPHCMTRYRLLYHRKCRECGNDLCVCDCTKEGVERLGVWRLGKLCAYLPKEKNNPFKGMLYAFKHKNNTDVRELFSCEMTDMIRRKCPGYAEYTVCYVPRSTSSYRKHGYDHMHELAMLIARNLDVRCEVLFCRNDKARVQKELGRAARFDNAQKSIVLADGVDVRARRFILLDDVCVTGASLGRCASLLISEGAREVRVFVIAVKP